MMCQPKQAEPKLFYTGVNLADRIPPNHPLRQIKALIPFESIRRRVADCYGGNGHVSADPTVLLKLLFLLYYENVRSERELVQHLRYRLDWLWFCNLDLDDPIPHHSVLSKARRRWGLQVFEEAFAEILQLCVAAGLVADKTVHVDATGLTANASVESRIPRRLWEQLEAGLSPFAAEEAEEDDRPSGGPGVSHRTPPPAADSEAADLPAAPQGAFNRRTVSRTDPDAATTARRGRGVRLGYGDHRLVDDSHGVILATVAAPGDYDDGAMLPSLLDRHRRYLDRDPEEVVGDSAYGTAKNMQALCDQGIAPYLKRRAGRNGVGNWLAALPSVCDRRRARRLMKRRLSVIEGRFGEAHVRHGHRRCRWRRRWRVQIQCYLVAMVQNIGKLARSRRRPSPVAGQAGVLGRLSSRFYAFASRLDALSIPWGHFRRVLTPIAIPISIPTTTHS